DPTGHQSLTELNLTLALATTVLAIPAALNAFRALDKALITLWSSGLISTITNPGLDAYLSRAVPQELAQRRDEAKAQVETAERQCNCRGEVLFHYTSQYRAL